MIITKPKEEKQKKFNKNEPKYAGWHCPRKDCGTIIYMASENDIKEHKKIIHSSQPKQKCKGGKC